MAKSGKSQYAILGMLGALKESSGYDLKKHMEASTNYFWKETFSSIYPVLEALEKQHLIKKVEKAKKNDRQRNVYTLTPEGKVVLENWLMQPPENAQLRNEQLLKLFFGHLVPVEITVKHLEKQRNELEQKLTTFLKIKEELSQKETTESVYWLLTLDHGIRQVSSSLEWCNNAIKILKK